MLYKRYSVLQFGEIYSTVTEVLTAIYQLNSTGNIITFADDIVIGYRDPNWKNIIMERENYQ